MQTVTVLRWPVSFYLSILPNKPTYKPTYILLHDCQLEQNIALHCHQRYTPDTKYMIAPYISPAYDNAAMAALVVLGLLAVFWQHSGSILVLAAKISGYMSL